TRVVHEVRRLGGARRRVVLRVRLRVRPHDGAGRLVLRDGRQPRQLAGQPVLGLREARQDQGQGLPHLLVLGRRSTLAALVATRELYTVERWVGRLPSHCCSGVHEVGFTEGGLREMRPGSADPKTHFLVADNPSSSSSRSSSSSPSSSSVLAESAPEREITVECNPESVTREKLAGYRGAGVNRLSLGVQSLDDAILPRLGRLHDARGARAAFDAAREAGCANLSVDVMYGLPGLDLDGWTRAVAAVLDCRPDPLSAYALTLDAGRLA